MARYRPFLGLGGRKRHGKDTAADHLVREWGFVKIGMSDALHEMLLTLDPWMEMPVDWQDYDDSVERYSKIISEYGYEAVKERVPEARRMLQVLGTEIGRAADEDIWVRAMVRKVQEAYDNGARGVVVTGIRYANEYNAITRLGGMCAYVLRVGYPDDGDTHTSERSLRRELFPHTIYNDTLTDLYEQTDVLAKELLKRANHE